MIIPCMDLMDGKAVQLVQGREKALEVNDPLALLETFAAFAEIQLIDLDAALGRGSNDPLVRTLASRAVARVGGGVRTVERARSLVDQGAHKVIIGTAAFGPDGANGAFLEALAREVGSGRVLIALDSKAGRVVIRGWREATRFSAEDVIHLLEPYCSGFLCTYVDKEGMMQGTDLEWFRRLRAATDLEITAAGGISTMEEIQELEAMRVNAALGMAMYTGRISLDDLVRLQTTPASANPHGMSCPPPGIDGE